jgi:hypothetical protein
MASIREDCALQDLQPKKKKSGQEYPLGMLLFP